MPNKIKKEESPQVEKLVEEIQDIVKPEPPEDNLRELKRKLAEQNKKIDMLLEVADKKSLSNYYDRNKESLPTYIKVRTLDKKVIIGWKSICDDVDRDMVSGRVVEKQEVLVFFKDGTKGQYPLVIFERNYKSVTCRLISLLTNADGTRAYKLARLDTDEIIEIGDRFVN